MSLLRSWVGVPTGHAMIVTLALLTPVVIETAMAVELQRERGSKATTNAISVLGLRYVQVSPPQLLLDGPG